MQDRGGRSRWDEYSLATANGAGPSASNGGPGLEGSSAAAATGSTAEPSSGYAAPKYQGGYAPARTPSPDRVAAQQRQQQLDYQKQLEAQQRAEQDTKEQQAKEQQAKEQQAKEQQAKEQQAKEQQAKEDQAKELQARSTETASSSNVVAPTPATAAASTSAATSAPTPNINAVTRVRALYTFEPTEPGELSFEKGDIIKVVDRGYQDWWRGQIKGRTGIFPVNYVVRLQ